MPKYMFIYRGGHEKMKHASPEKIQQVMQMWLDWIESGTKDGWMLDAGDGLKPSGAFVNMDLSVTNELFAESKTHIGGYSLIKAANLTTAIELAKDSPMPKSGGIVEVREITNSGK